MKSNKKSLLKLSKLNISKLSNPYQLKGAGDPDVKRSKNPLCPTRINTNGEGPEFK